MDYNPVGWFEIPVSNSARAQKFYESLFNISMKRQDIPDYEMTSFPAEREAKGIPGALFKGTGYTPSPTGVVIYFTCPQIDETIKRAESLGSIIKLPKKDIGENGYIAWITDSEGNIIGLHRTK